MPDVAHWMVLLGAALILLVIPGPSIMYVVARGIAQGSRAAVLSSVGLALDDLRSSTAIGLSAVLASAPTVLVVLKYAGASYLVILGLTTLAGRGTRGSRSFNHTAGQPGDSATSLILQGLLALNPKTTLFFLAFLPQFVARDAGSATVQILAFGVAFVVLGFLTNSMFGCLGGALARLSETNTRLQGITCFAGGGVLIALDIVAACMSTP